MIGSQQSQVRIQQPLSRHLFLCQSKRQWQAIINARFSAKSRSPHLFTLRKKRHSSSSWAGKSPNFRREIRQSHYRNDPVKYDLNSTPPILPVWQTRNQTTNCWAKTWNHPTKWCILFVMPSPTFNCCSFSHYTSIVKDCPCSKLCAIYREMGKLFLPTCAPPGRSLPFPPYFMSKRCFGRPNLLANGFSPKIWKVLNFASNFLRNWDNFWRWPHSFCRAHMN